MTNIIRLFARRTETHLGEPQARISPNVSRTVSSSEELTNAVQQFLKLVVATEHAVGTIDDMETREKLEQSIKLGLESVSKAMLNLTQAFEILADVAML